MIKTFNLDIKNIYTQGIPVKAVYTHGIKVWPSSEPTPVGSHWVEKDWGEHFPNEGKDVCHLINNLIYYFDLSSSNNLEYYNWEWHPYDDFSPRGYGKDVWQDNDGNFYYSDYYYHQKYVNGNWVYITDWTGINFYGRDVWKHGDQIYASSNNKTYRFNNGYWGETFLGYVYPEGSHVWHDFDGHTFCDTSMGTYEFENGTWKNKNWTGNYKPSNGSKVWYDTNDMKIYYSDHDTQLELEKITTSYPPTLKWKPKEWNGPAPEYGDDVYYLGDKAFYSHGNTQLELIN